MAKQDAVVELFYAGTWNTMPVYTRDSIRITRQRPEGTEPTPATAALTLQGFHNPLSPLSPLFGLAGQNTPVRITLDSDVRFYGEVSSWEPRRTVDHNPATGKGDAWTSITAAGILRRLGQGTDPLGSAMVRSMSGVTENDYEPLDYWPAQDGQDATLIGAYTPGTLPAVISGDVVPAFYAGATGSDAVPVINAGGSISGEFSPTTLVASGTGDTIAQIQFMATIPATMSADANFMDIVVPPGTGDNIAFLRILWVDATSMLTLRWYNTLDVPVSWAELDFSAGDLYDTPLLFAISLFTDVVGTPGKVNVGFSAWSPQTVGFPVAFDFDTWTAAAVPVPQTWEASATAVNAGWALGHFALYTDPAVILGSNVSDNARAIDGFAGEQVHERLTRLCREKGIPLTVDGTESQTQGPQYSDTLTALFAEGERTDDGSLFEPRDSYGLVYRCGRERINRDVALVLDYAAQEIGGELAPVLDDLVSRNDVTVSRRNGGSARAVLESGRLSVQEPPDGIGRYTTRVDVNTETDDILPHHAGWHLSKGTVEGVRYIRVTVDLDAKPALVGDAGAVDVGDIIALDNLPADEATGRVLLMVTGYTETIGSHRRLITFDCTPAKAYDVAVYGTDPGGIVSRYGARSTVLAEDLTPTETAVDVNSGGEPWAKTSTHSAAFPFNVNIGGLTYSCTAITGTNPNYTLTIVRLPVDKAHSTGDAVTVTDTGRYGL